MIELIKKPGKNWKALGPSSSKSRRKGRKVLGGNTSNRWDGGTYPKEKNLLMEKRNYIFAPGWEGGVLPASRQDKGGVGNKIKRQNLHLAHTTNGKR